MDDLLLGLLVAQGLMGGYDTLVNHELIERLRQRRSARTEVGLHAWREGLYAAIFFALGWFLWYGATAGIIVALLLAEFLVSTADEYVENKTRVLPHNERILHVLLTVNFGVLLAVSGVVLFEWAQQPTGVTVRDTGPLTWVLSALGGVSLFWAIQDLVSWSRPWGVVDSPGSGPGAVSRQDRET